MLHTTWTHPFWNADQQRWTDAKDLKPGTHLRDADGGITQIVTAVKIWTGLQWMNDLTIADTHTYYVVAGNTPVLVHNCDLRDIAANHRETGNNGQGIGKDRNIAVARATIDGADPELLIATSGKHVNPGEVGMPATRRFNPGSRPFDAETHIFETLADGLSPTSTGTVDLYSELTVCPSCEGVMDQFKQAFPGVNINITTG